MIRPEGTCDLHDWVESDIPRWDCTEDAREPNSNCEDWGLRLLAKAGEVVNDTTVHALSKTL